MDAQLFRSLCCCLDSQSLRTLRLRNVGLFDGEAVRCLMIRNARSLKSIDLIASLETEDGRLLEPELIPLGSDEPLIFKKQLSLDEALGCWELMTSATASENPLWNSDQGIGIGISHLLTNLEQLSLLQFDDSAAIGRLLATLSCSVALQRLEVAGCCIRMQDIPSLGRFNCLSALHISTAADRGSINELLRYCSPLKCLALKMHGSRAEDFPLERAILRHRLTKFWIEMRDPELNCNIQMRLNRFKDDEKQGREISRDYF